MIVANQSTNQRRTAWSSRHMMNIRSTRRGHLQRAGIPLLLALAATLAGCAGLATQPAPAAQGLAGDWQRDAASSEDFDRKLAQLLDIRRQKLRARHAAPARSTAGAEGRGGRSGHDADSNAGFAGEDAEGFGLSPEEPERERQRLADDLQPPGGLSIAIEGGTVRITSAGEPVRVFVPGQRVSRIDGSGAAQLDCGWEERAFVVRASYVHRATRSWRYELESPGGLLRLSFEASDPDFGKLTLVSRYRRS
jgi:hypothetical protein